jgi:hypothetical protein
VNDWSVAIGATGLVGAAVYFYVGDRLRRRPVPDRAKLPSLEFTVWWWGLAASATVGGVEGILWAFGALSLAVALTCTVVSLLVTAAALWGLVGYLTYLYTGKYRLLEWSVFYTILFLSVLYYEFSLDPAGVTAAAGIPQLRYAHAATASVPELIYLVAAILLPEVVGIALYFSLIRKTTDRTLRYRIALVTLSLVLFFGFDIIGLPASVIPPVVWSLVKGAVEAGASVLSLIAYLPPAWIQRALRIASVATPEGGSSPGPGSG